MSGTSFVAYLATFSLLIPATFCIDYLFEGEACKMNNGSDGICGTFTNCGEAFSIPLDPPKICSPRGDEFIICCPPDYIKKKTPIKYEDTETCSLLEERDSKQTEESLSAKACRMYSDVYNDNSEKPAMVSGNIVTDMGNYPFMAALGYTKTDANNKAKTVYGCGGMLISDRFVLTAAHCGDKDTPAVVKMGAVNLTDNNADSNEFDVQSFIAHPCYSMSISYYDIALVKLTKPILVSNFIFPACIIKEPEPEFEKMYSVTGWGATSKTGNRPSKTLLEVSLTVQDPDKCNSKWQPKNGSMLPRGFTRNTLICAINPVKGAPCNGDSGGPLSVQHRFAHYTVVAVISQGGSGCSDKDKPSILTKIYPFLLWIEDVIWPDGNIEPLEWQDDV